MGADMVEIPREVAEILYARVLPSLSITAGSDSFEQDAEMLVNVKRALREALAKE